jgi:glycerol uptake facilitator-like aquaporin
MESISKASTWSKLLYEFIGTAIMVYSFNSSSDPLNVRARPMAYFILWILAYKISGAHFNPATSIAAFIIEGKCMNGLGLFLTIIAQCVGAWLGIALGYLLIKDYLGNYDLLPNLIRGY